LQRKMMEHARRRGVRGFVAEILSSNENMIRLARAAELPGAAGTGSGGPRVTVEHSGGTVRVTTLL
jgi:hypothetical protein